MWSNVISIDRSYDREIEYILGSVGRTKDVSYAIEKSRGRIFIYLAGLCERQAEIEKWLNKLGEVVILSYMKLRFFLEKLKLGRISHAKCALLCSIIYYDREFESSVVNKVFSDSLEYNIDGIMNFRLRALSDAWEELAALCNRLLDDCADENDIYEIATFITGSEGKPNQLALNNMGLRNLTQHRGVEIVRLFDSEEYNLISAIIKEKPFELLLEKRDFSEPMNDTLRRIVRVIEK